MTAALGVATVMLGAVALGLGLLAFWGYREMRKAAINAAEREACRTAEDVAARQMQAFLDKQERAPDISQAYEVKPP